MLKFIPYFLFLGMVSSSWAGGISFDEGDKLSRFVEKYDKNYGWIIVDNALDKEFMLCPVGMSSTQDSKKCTGEPQYITHLEATALAKKVGGGWSLPHKDTFTSYANASNYFWEMTKKDVGKDHRYWTSTWLRDHPDHWFFLSVSVEPSKYSGWNAGAIDFTKATSESMVLFYRDKK